MKFPIKICIFRLGDFWKLFVENVELMVKGINDGIVDGYCLKCNDLEINYHTANVIIFSQFPPCLTKKEFKYCDRKTVYPLLQFQLL